jgi:hypothetical protein
MLTQDRVREMFDYDPILGVISRIKINKPSNVRLGPIKLKPHGTCKYPCVFLDGKSYMVHDIIWLWVTGEFPKDQIDHENLDKFDIRWENLREATNAQNCSNQPARRTNTSGLKGVSWHKAARKWTAATSNDGRPIYLGVFDCPAAASFAYQVAVDKFRGRFARAF